MDERDRKAMRKQLNAIKYERIPMDEIHPEARNIAVSWIENYKPHQSLEIAQKVKLASDIMNFAKAYHKERLREEAIQVAAMAARII